MPAIDILLSTHNGAAYLPALLDSLSGQTFRDWRLIVRDDGSKDDSVIIVEGWARRRRHDLNILSDRRGPLGPCGSFGALLQHSRSPYFALCDQDDVWLPSKLADVIACIQMAEARMGAAAPILAHSDLLVVDAALRPVHRSFWACKGFRSAAAVPSLPQLVLQNHVTGCASLGNAALRRAALPVPNHSMMHDWWLAMVATAFGEIIAHPAPLVLYRQHSGNVIGTRSWGAMSLARRFLRNPRGVIAEGRMHIALTQRRADAFVQRFAGSLETEAEAVLRAYARLNEGDFWTRKAFLFRSGMWTSSSVANIGLLAAI